MTALVALPVALHADPAEHGNRELEAPKLGDAQRAVAPPTIDHGAPKVEAVGRASAYSPPTGASGPTARAVSVGHPHRVVLLSFDPRQLRAGPAKQLDDVARSWTSLGCDALTLDSYAAARGGSAAVNVKLAQRNADEVRTYLVHHGVPGDSVIAVGHTEPPSGATSAKIELSVTACDPEAIMATRSRSRRR